MWGSNLNLDNDFDWSSLFSPDPLALCRYSFLLRYATTNLSIHHSATALHSPTTDATSNVVKQATNKTRLYRVSADKASWTVQGLGDRRI
jgi:hypothetical protein